MTTLATMIRDARNSKNMTQHDLAIALDLRSGAPLVSTWERGALPKPSNVHDLIAVLDLDHDETWLAFGRAVDDALAL